MVKSERMNERIKALTEQAGFIRFSPEEDPDTPIDWSSDYTSELEKFAELIVRECADIALREDFDPSDCILKHFGVEE
jgi:hypothetical protein